MSEATTAELLTELVRRHDDENTAPEFREQYRELITTVPDDMFPDLAEAVGQRLREINHSVKLMSRPRAVIGQRSHGGT